MQYTVAAAARAAGISPWRLRTWERRYGIPHPGRSATGRRVYTEEDLQVVRRMAALVRQGIPASQAAEVVHGEAALGAGPPPAVSERPVDPRVHALVAAARDLDEAAAVGLMRDVAAERGWPGALEEVVVPALHAVGDLWERGDAAVMQEHFFSQLVRRELMHAISALPSTPGEGPLVLLAGAEDERHEIGQLALWLLLRQRGLRVMALGPDVPPAEVVLAARRAQPAAVCLTGVITPSAPMLAAAARALIEARIPARIFVGGAAVAPPTAARDIPATVLPQDLAAAVDMIVEELGR